MSGFVAVFFREFRSRRLLLLGALFGGLGAVAIPYMAGRTGPVAVETALDAAVLIACITGVLFAALLGAGAVAGDLTHHRLGFDFGRPISGWAIWAGRFGAAVALLFASTALAVFPAGLLAGRTARVGEWAQTTALPGSPDRLGLLGTASLISLACVVLLFLVHAIGVFYTSRSGWLTLDLAGLLAVGWIGVGALSRLESNWALEALAISWVAFAVCAGVVLVAASCAQVLYGRVDVARGHRALSMVLWGGLLVGALGLQFGSRWVVSPSVGDLVNTQVKTAPRGSWFTVSGYARHRGKDHGAAFLIDAATGRTVRLGPSRNRGWIAPSFSADGRHAVWVQQERGLPWEIVRLDLSRPGARPETMRLGLPFVVETLSLSPTGRWVAALAAERLFLWDLDRSKLVATIPVTYSTWQGLLLAWVGNDRLRWFVKGAEEETSRSVRIEIREVGLPAGRVEKRAEVLTVPLGFSWGISEDGSTVLVLDRRGERRLLFDGATGEPLGALPAPPRSSAALLPDGRVAVVLRDADTADRRTLALFARDGREIGCLDLPRFRYLRLGGLSAPDRWLAAGSAHGSIDPAVPDDPAAWNLFAIDLSAMKVAEVGRGLPADRWRSDPGSPGARLVMTGEASFSLWNPDTQKLAPLRLRPAE